MTTRTGAKVGIALPQSLEDGVLDLDAVRQYAQRAEALGFDDVWTIEQITGRFPVLEPLALLSYLAAVTTRVRLGTAVVVLNLRNPVQLAKEVSSLDHLSDGRVTLGIGLGTNTRMYPAFGMPEDRRVARFNEAVRVLKALWTEQAASLEGEYWRLDGTGMEPKPVQKPHPPLWYGAHSEAAMTRAARHGDGWMGSGSTDVDEFFRELARVQEILQAHGRDLQTYPRSKRVYTSVHEDEAIARERLQRWLDAFYGRPEARAESWGVYGSPERCLDTLGRMREAGLTHFMLHPALTNLEQLEIIAEKIVPHI
jgi:probable F420-dependent oxidoreductase